MTTFRPGIALGLVLPFSVFAQTKQVPPPPPSPECSIAKTNHSCTLTIDRTSPLAPPTIQLYPGAKVNVRLTNPYYFERYFMDYTSGQLALAPDIASSIATGALPSLKNLGEFHDLLFKAQIAIPKSSESSKPDCSKENISKHLVASPGDIPNVNDLYVSCLADFATKATNLYRQLEPVVAPDSHTQETDPPFVDPSTLSGISGDIKSLYQDETELSDAITAASKGFDTISGPPPPPPSSGTGSSGTPPPAGVQNLTPDQAKMVRFWVAGAALTDAVAKDLFSFSARIDDLVTAQLLKDFKRAPSVNLFPINDPPADNVAMVTRQVTYAIDALNLVQNAQEGIPDPTKKRTIASITVLYGDARWELSAGTFFSTLANRSFAISPVITNGAVSAKQVTQTALYPTVVPFAAANLRIGDDLKLPKWRMAWYWTFAVGINPNTTTTDFATGPSISWRGLMFSGLWHIGHDVRLTQGLYNTQLLDAMTMVTATTQSYWRFDRVAIGVSVRVPSLTGR